MNQAVVVVNAGSSSIKFSVYTTAGDELEVNVKGQIEGIGTGPRFVAKDAGGTVLADDRLDARDHTGCLAHLRHWLEGHLKGMELVGIGHRVVHGGTEFAAPVRVDTDILARLESFVPLAPLHQPHNLAVIRAINQIAPDLPQVACFDTAFHRRHPKVADQFALPSEWYEVGIRRYGFHGLPYEYISRRLPEIAPDIAGGRVIIAHLGNGASLCAVNNGRSVDSTMGFTALDGLPMGTRCGALDPGVMLYLLDEHGMTTRDLEDMLYRHSGLLGLSGISNDVRDLLASDDPRAEEALAYFVYRIRREIGALAAALEGLDGLVFTAGIGENSPAIRARVCAGLDWLGIELDEQANSSNGPRISHNRSPLSVWVIPTDEELMIARHTLAVLNST